MPGTLPFHGGNTGSNPVGIGSGSRTRTCDSWLTVSFPTNWCCRKIGKAIKGGGYEGTVYYCGGLILHTNPPPSPLKWVQIVNLTVHFGCLMCSKEFTSTHNGHRCHFQRISQGCWQAHFAVFSNPYQLLDQNSFSNYFSSYPNMNS